MTDTAAVHKGGLVIKALNGALWVAGFGVGIYSGVNLLIPLFASFGAFLVSTKLLGEKKKLIIPALSVNAGHFLWLVLGVVLTGNLKASAADLLVYAIGLLWLVRKPSAAPLYLLCTYQAFSFAVNAVSFAGAPIGSSIHKALLVHLIFRALALFLMAKLLLTLSRQKAQQPDAP